MSFLGKRHSEDTKEKISVKNKGNPSWNRGKRLGSLSNKVREKISKKLLGKNAWNKGKKLSEETRRKMSSSHKGKPGMNLGKIFSKEIRERMRIAQLGKKRSPRSKEWCKKLSEARKKSFKDPIYLENYKNGQRRTPNKSEETLTVILNILFPDKYKYVGNHEVWIDGKNPDWINEEEKKIIEFFGWRHTEESTEIPNEIHEKERIDHFNKNGYKCLVIWFYDMKNSEETIERIKNFCCN